MPEAFYNEFDPFAAAWLRELIKEGHIANGIVDERSIADLKSDELRGFTQVHLFAGIGGWSLGLRIAGTPDNQTLWTGSCPCQPFSANGKRKGFQDERHLWPEMFRLIRECKPNTVFGEQVEGAIGHGWLDTVSADLESEGYAVGSVVLGAHSVGLPQVRKRLYWVADSNNNRADGEEWSRMEACVQWETQEQSKGLLGLALGEIGWTSREWPSCQPLLVPSHDGIPEILAGFGNSIVPQVAAEFMKSFYEVKEGHVEPENLNTLFYPEY